jgi:hypothetical protein
MKRKLSDAEDTGRRSQRRLPDGKRRRVGARREILDCSDEILLKVFQVLDVPEIILADRVCQRFHRLASDSEVWKAKFYERFVEPRARRIPQAGRPSTTKLVRWLEHGALLRDGHRTDWKRQYRIRNNWDRGEARLHEVEVARPPAPPVLARAVNGRIYTADADNGLRVWPEKRLTHGLETSAALKTSQPSSLAVDGDAETASIVVGFEDGHLEFYGHDGLQLTRNIAHSASSSPIVAAAISSPYTVIMTADRHIHLYNLSRDPKTQAWSAVSVASLHADSPIQPAALSVRSTALNVIATIAYAFHRLGDGWCLGLQEVIVSRANGEVESRTTTNIDSPLDARYQGRKQWAITSRSAFSTPLTSPFSLNPEVKHPPTSLSYCHPFLLASLADNTIMSYIVHSDDDKLEVSSGRRLFGHTSAITSAEVSNRGKAVSISAKGDDIRVWELEELLTTFRGRPSTKVKPRTATLDIAAALANRGNGLGLALEDLKRELAMTRRWVSFDDEQVVILGERDQRQIMACYDFSV